MFFSAKVTKTDFPLNGQSLQAGSSHDISLLIIGANEALTGSSVIFLAKGAAFDPDDSARIKKIGAIAPSQGSPTGDFTLTVVDNRMTGIVHLDPIDTRELPVGTLLYAFQWKSSDGKQIEEWGGSFQLVSDLIKAV